MLVLVCMQGISCSKAQCQEVLLKHKEAGDNDVWKCVGCGCTVSPSNVDATGPLDIENQADSLYAQAMHALQEQVTRHCDLHFSHDTDWLTQALHQHC